MFTGIITDIGAVQRVTRHRPNLRVRIQAPKTAPKLRLGGSVAVSGACLTVVKRGKNSFDAEVVPETLRRTWFSKIKHGTRLNLETPLRLVPDLIGDPLDGHLVQGHVDGTGTVTALERSRRGRLFTIRFPSELRKFIAKKGSIAVDGVSLTIASTVWNTCTVALIPATLKRTTLGSLAIGRPVNLEVDLIARSLDRLIRR